MTTIAELDHWQEQFKQFVQGQFQEHASDPAHDIAHIERVVSTGISLCDEESATLEIVLPACWLHDCVNVPKTSPLRSQGSVLSADRAIEYLRTIHYPERYFDAIHHAIAAHSFSAKLATNSLEAEIVQDADRLDALGAVGLSRCLMLGGSWGSSLYNLDDPFGKSRAFDDKKYSVDHFFVKLKGLVATMKTKAGLAQAQTRWHFMESYLQQLGKEIGIDY